MAYHPPWFVHLFMADTIASILHLTFHECLMESVHDSTPGMQSENFLLPHHVRPKVEQYYSKLPPPHSSTLNYSYCKDSYPFLDISAEQVQNIANDVYTGTYTLNSSWSVYSS